jgi:ketosteroid isomerase-like protein
LHSSLAKKQQSISQNQGVTKMTNSNATDIERVLQDWAKATQTGQQNEVLAAHLPDVLIYDVLAPMKYEGAVAYKESWDEWQPDTQGEGQFDWEDLQVTAGTDVAFAHGFIRCGGQLPDGGTFTDLVRATFCLRNVAGQWKVAHQHVSKPISMGSTGQS